MKSVILFIAIMVIFFLIDMIWLGFIAKDLYANQIGFLLKKTGDNLTPNWYAAIAVYIALALGLMLFVLPKAGGHYGEALLWGALFGFVCYAIYDFTNLSILAGWPLKISLIDLAWGTFLCGTTSVIAAFIQTKLS